MKETELSFDELNQRERNSPDEMTDFELSKVTGGSVSSISITKVWDATSNGIFLDNPTTTPTARGTGGQIGP